MTGAARAGPPDGRTLALLQAPLVPTLLRLSAPNVVGLLAGTVTIAYDGWVVGHLGADALAGVALVFPLAVLMVQMSGGGMGGATTAAVARALGAGRRDQAGLLAQQALWVAAAFAALYMAVMLPFGGAIYRALGGRGAVLDAAVDYGSVFFAGAPLIWCANILSGVARGSGQMMRVSALIIGSASVHLVLCPLLVLGTASWPGLGVAGAAASSLVTNALVAVALLAWLLRGRGPVRLIVSPLRPRRDDLRTLLQVGLPAMLGPVLSNASIATATSWIATLGTAALAGFSLAARIEYVVLPIAFGFGSTLTTLVATNLGAGQGRRALRAAWTGAGMVAAITGSFGLAAAIWPHEVLAPFARSAEVRDWGAGYLQVAGGCYGLFGLGLSLFFACQGAGQMRWPLVAGLARLATVALGGWLVLPHAAAHPQALFVAVAAGFVVYATIIVTATALGRWGQR